MKRFTEAINLALANDNNYAALMTALAMPDICGYLLDPKEKPGKRYRAWFNKYVAHHYVADMGGGTSHVFMVGNDCYALRCAYLHQGVDDASDQPAKPAVTRFKFTTSPRCRIHCNTDNYGRLQLQVDIFCGEIVSGIEQFSADVKDDAEVQARIGKLLLIESALASPGQSMWSSTGFQYRY